MLSIKFWTFTDIFMQIGPWEGAKMAVNCTNYVFLALFQSDGVLETSEAALDTFSKMTVSLKQAKQHSIYISSTAVGSHPPSIGLNGEPETIKSLLLSSINSKDYLDLQQNTSNLA